MLFSIFEQFGQESPVTVMARGLIGRVFAADRMDRLFATHAKGSEVSILDGNCLAGTDHRC